MNRFIRMMHHSLSGKQSRDSRVNTLQDFAQQLSDIEPITVPLETAFPIQDEWLRLDLPTEPIVAAGKAEVILKHFRQMIRAVKTTFHIRPEPQSEEWTFFGTAFVRSDGRLATTETQVASARQQPLALFLRTITGDGRVLLRCVSPIGVVPRTDEERIERICAAQQQLGFGKLCAVEDVRRGTYDLTAETDMLFDPVTTQSAEVIDLVDRTTRCADHMERVLLGSDQPMKIFRYDLVQEPQRA